MDAAQVVTATAEPVGAIGAASYFHPDTLARGKELGLDGFRFYLLGRAGVLGDVEAPVVTAAFGWWSPATIDKIWTSAKEKVEPRPAAREYLECAAALGRDRLGDVEGLDDLCGAAEAVVDAADPAGLSLFAGIAAEPLPDDPPGRAMRLLVTLRELRGSVHLVAVLATGLSPRVAHQIRRPEMREQFGWPEDVEVTDDDHRLLAEADEVTDRMLVPAYRPIEGDRGERFVDRVRAVAAALR